MADRKRAHNALRLQARALSQAFQAHVEDAVLQAAVAHICDQQREFLLQFGGAAAQQTDEMSGQIQPDAEDFLQSGLVPTFNFESVATHSAPMGFQEESKDPFDQAVHLTSERKPKATTGESNTAQTAPDWEPRQTSLKQANLKKPKP